MRRACHLLLLCALIAPAAGAQWSIATFGDHGELIEVRIADYGELFPEGQHGVPAEYRVMALDITPVEGELTRFLVPGTDNSARESRPSLIHDSGQVFLLWGSADGEVLSSLHLIGFDGESWTQPVEVSGDPRHLKGPARLALTRDPYGPTGLGAHRTTVHLLWWEQDAGNVEVLYTPIVFVAGRYIGWNPVVSLDRFDSNPDLDSPAEALEILRAANIQVGADERSVVVALPQEKSGRLLTLAVRVVPASLRGLADDARGHIVIVGRADPGPGSIAALGRGLRQEIDGSEANLHAGVLSYIADQVVAELADFGPTYRPADIDAIADRVWTSVVEAGASILGNSLRATDQSCEMLQLGPSPERATPSLHQIELCLVSDRPLPETDPFSLHALYLSEDGERVLVAWLDPEGGLHYRKSTAEGWSEAITVSIVDSLGPGRALAMLERLVRRD